MRKWSKKYDLDGCLECESGEQIHRARGLCNTCYKRDLYHKSESLRISQMNANRRYLDKKKKLST